MEAIRVMEQRNNVTLAGKWTWDRFPSLVLNEPAVTWSCAT
jgi:hypothetical protein